MTVFYNQAKNYWKIVLNSGVFYILTKNEQQVLRISEVTPISSVTSIDSFSVLEMAAVDNVLKFSSKVAFVSGKTYPFNNGKYYYYRLQVILQNRMRFECELVTLGEQRANFILISYRSIAPEPPAFSFGPASGQIPQ